MSNEAGGRPAGSHEPDEGEEPHQVQSTANTVVPKSHTVLMTSLIVRIGRRERRTKLKIEKRESKMSRERVKEIRVEKGKK
jgi:hypothetical protein